MSDRWHLVFFRRETTMRNDQNALWCVAYGDLLVGWGMPVRYFGGAKCCCCRVIILMTFACLDVCVIYSNYAAGNEVWTLRISPYRLRDFPCEQNTGKLQRWIGDGRCRGRWAGTKTTVEGGLAPGNLWTPGLWLWGDRHIGPSTFTCLERIVEFERSSLRTGITFRLEIAKISFVVCYSAWLVVLSAGVW